jgi:hypothetical protein
MTGTSLGSESAVNRICFRGDLRPPSESYKHQFDENAGREPILTSAGFDARNQDATPVYRPKEGAAGDADPESGVCVTPRFTVAPLFPIQNFPWTWIYVVYVEKAYNTKMRQVIDSQQVMKNISSGTFLQNVVRYAAGLRRYAPHGGCTAGGRHHVVAVWRRTDCRSPAGGKHYLRHQVQAA